MKRLAISLTIFSLIACSEPNVLTAGEVTELEYDDPDQWLSTYCVAYTKEGICYAYASQTHYEDAHYKLKIVGIHDDKTKEEWHEVDETEYHSCQKGDHYEKGRGCNTG